MDVVFVTCKVCGAKSRYAVGWRMDSLSIGVCNNCLLEEEKGNSSLDRQEGGSHYKEYAIQPVEFITKNELGFIEGCVVKYVCRHRNKNGAEDIKKAIHYLQLLLEIEYECK